MTDPESTEGRAKPYYETALSLLEKKADASPSLLIECESYLGYYYFLQKTTHNHRSTGRKFWNWTRKTLRHDKPCKVSDSSRAFKYLFIT